MAGLELWWLGPRLASELGLPADRIVGAQPDEPIEHDGVRIFPVPACHGIDVSDAYTFGEDLTDSNGLVRLRACRHLLHELSLARY